LWKTLPTLLVKSLNNTYGDRPLLGLFRALSLMALLVYAGAVVLMWRETLRETRATLTYINSMLVQSTRTTLKGHELILRGLAGELISHGTLEQPEQGRSLIERMKTIDPGMAGFGLAKPDGQLLLVSGIPPGEPLPNLSERSESADSFNKALESGHLETGRPYFFKRLRGWVVPIRVPIVDSAGELTAVMTAGYRIKGGTTSWSNMKLPEEVSVGLMGDDGYLLYLHPLPEGNAEQVLEDVYRQPVAPAVRQWIAGLRSESAFEPVFLPRSDGTSYVAYTNIPEFGLHAATTLPLSAVIGAWAERLLLPTALLLIFLGGGFWAFWRARQQEGRAQARLQRSREALIERNESLRLINRFSQRLQGTLDLQDILDETVKALLGLKRPPHIAIYLLDDERHQLQLVATHGFDDVVSRLGAELPLEGSLSGLAMSEQHTLVSTEIATDERLEPRIRAALVDSGARTAISIPIIYADQALGTINLIYDGGKTLSERSKETLRSLSNTVALAITNARHVDGLAFQARHDSLTGLPNRVELHDGIAAFIAESAETDREAALLLLDLDRFKEVNDTLGHHFGDLILAAIGPRLMQACADNGALAARLGGDEFAIFLTATDAPALAPDSAPDLARHLLEVVSRPTLAEGIEIRTSASIGIAYYPRDGDDSHALLRAADVAMYRAKTLSLGVVEYDRGFDTYSTERLALANELEVAIQQGQLVLHYQPKLDIGSGRIIGLEALVRWRHPRLGLLYPDRFIDLVEMSELIHPFTKAVINQAIADREHLAALGHCQSVAINLSARNLTGTGCMDCLQASLDAYKQPASAVELELTETALMDDPGNAADLLQQFSDLGVKIAIDDYGSGYSSLAYLRRLPVDTLKIDRSFVTDIGSNEQNCLIVRSTIALAHSLDLEVIAEGVEDAATLELLREMACDQAQGYLLSRPLPLDEIIVWLDQWRSKVTAGTGAG
jgi:diguanylate cyclase (GGDEF)-like protein